MNSKHESWDHLYEQCRCASASGSEGAHGTPVDFFCCAILGFEDLRPQARREELHAAWLLRYRTISSMRSTCTAGYLQLAGRPWTLYPLRRFVSAFVKEE